MIGRLAPPEQGGSDSRRATVQTRKGERARIHPCSINCNLQVQQQWGVPQHCCLMAYDEITRGDGSLYLRCGMAVQLENVHYKNKGRALLCVCACTVCMQSRCTAWFATGYVASCCCDNVKHSLLPVNSPPIKPIKPIKHSLLPVNSLPIKPIKPIKHSLLPVNSLPIPYSLSLLCLVLFTPQATHEHLLLC